VTYGLCGVWLGHLGIPLVHKLQRSEPEDKKVKKKVALSETIPDFTLPRGGFFRKHGPDSSELDKLGGVEKYYKKGYTGVWVMVNRTLGSSGAGTGGNARMCSQGHLAFCATITPTNRFVEES